MKTAIVTGATSYLGLALANGLIEEEVAVHALQRADSDVGRLEERVPAAKIHRHDGTQQSLIEIFEEARPDTIFHLAGKYVRNEMPEDISELIAANITFGSQLLEAARHSTVKSFINTGSYSQFANNEGTAINFYAAAKQAYADILSYYVDLNVFNAVSLIIFDVYGPEDWRPKLFPALAAAQKDGTVIPMVTKSMPLYPVYIADVTTCFIQAASLLENNPAALNGRKFAVRENQATTVEEIVAAFEKLGDKAITVEWETWPEPHRSVEMLWRGETLPGWEIQHNLADGIRLSIE